MWALGLPQRTHSQSGRPARGLSCYRCRRLEAPQSPPACHRWTGRQSSPIDHRPPRRRCLCQAEPNHRHCTHRPARGLRLRCRRLRTPQSPPACHRWTGRQSSPSDHRPPRRRCRATDLSPSTATVLIDPHVACVYCRCRRLERPNRHPRAIAGQGDRVAREIIGRLAVDVVTDLSPSTAIVVVDPHVA